MTKREICERVQDIRDYARVTDTWPHDNAAEQNLYLRNAVETITKLLGELLLDISTEMKEEDEKLLPIYKAWQKWDAIPGGSYMGVYDEAEGKIMHEVHKAMRQIKEEQGEPKDSH